MSSERVRVLAVLGESQHGKSSFINMISGTQSQRVGRGDGKSCTSELCPTKFRDCLQLFGNDDAQICCDDIPGFGDTGMLISNRQILEAMKIRLVGLGQKELDALLVFQSIAESRFELARTFARIEEMFGPDIIRSAIVIVTKSDMLAEKEKKKRLATITDIISSKDIPYVTWVNDSSEGQTEEEQRQRQAGSLRNILMRVEPYEVMNLGEFERLVAKRAKIMMAQDKSNTVQQTVAVPTQKIESYQAKECVCVPRVVPKYSEEEVRRLAQIKASLPENKRTEIFSSKEVIDVEAFDVVNEVKTVKTKSKIFWIIPINGNAEISTQKVVKKTVQREIPTKSIRLVQRDESEFEGDLRDQQRVEIREEERMVEKFRTKSSVENVTVTTTKRELAYYKKQAGKQMAVESWRQCAD